MRTLLMMTLSGSVLTLVLLALRYLLLRRMPSTVYYYAFLLVLLRFALPLPGLVPTEARKAQPVSPVHNIVSEHGTQEEPPQFDDLPLPKQDYSVSPAQTAAESAAPSADEAPAVPAAGSDRSRFSISTPALLGAIWLFGTLVSLSYTLISYFSFTARLRRTLAPAGGALLAQYTALPGKKPALYTCRSVKTPLMVGVFRPKIILPERPIGQEQLDAILRHELTHFRRGDALYKWASVLILSAHWFNPLSYFVRAEIGRACELSCDEMLLRGMNRAERQLYGETLLGMAASGVIPAGALATTFSTEKKDLRERLEQIMHYRKSPSRLIAALLALVLLTGCAAVAGPAAERNGGGLSSPAAERGEGVHVGSVDELLAAIAPDTLILLDEGEYDLSAASGYGTSESPYYSWLLISRESGEDEFELVIHDVDNLSLFGAGADSCSILAEPRYANVLRFVNCEGLILSELTLGHSTAPGFCRGGVVRLESCAEASVLYCSLFGCGTVGVSAEDCSDLSVGDCAIYECSYNAVHVSYCRNVRVTDCEIYRHGMRAGESSVMALFQADYTDGFVLNGNRVHDNRAQLLLLCSYTKNAFFLSNEVSDNSFEGVVFGFSPYPGVVDGCAFDGNEFMNWRRERSDSILDSEGNVLGDEALEAMRLRSIEPNILFPPVSAEYATEVEPGGSIAVTTVDELLAAIGPERTIVLDGELFDLAEATNYGSKGGEYYYWKERNDGPALVIHDVKALTILARSSDPAATTLSAEPRYADVLSFVNCSKLTLSGFTLGHTKEPGSCAGGVLSFDRCEGVAVDSCRLYGCGILGVQSANCLDLSLSSCEIYECSQGAGNFYRTDGLVFVRCNIHDVPSPALSFSECSDVRWNGEALIGERFDIGADGAPQTASAAMTDAALEDMRLRTWNGRELSSPDSIAELQNPYYTEAPHSLEPGDDRASFAAEVQQLIADGSWVQLSKRILFPVQVFSGDKAFHLWTPQEFVSSMADESFREQNGIEAFQSRIAAASLDELGNCLYGETFADHLLAFIAQDNGEGVISYRINCISLNTPLWPGNPAYSPAKPEA